MCTSSGTRIKILIFSDEEFSNYQEDLDIESYLKNGDGYNLKLSYHLLKQTYADGPYPSNNGNEYEVNLVSFELLRDRWIKVVVSRSQGGRQQRPRQRALGAGREGDPIPWMKTRGAQLRLSCPSTLRRWAATS